MKVWLLFFYTDYEIPLLDNFCVEFFKTVFNFSEAKSTFLMHEKLMCHRRYVTWTSNEQLISNKTVKINGFTLGRIALNLK